MKREDAQILKQLIDMLNVAEQKLERAFISKNKIEFKEAKELIEKIQEEIKKRTI